MDILLSQQITVFVLLFFCLIVGFLYKSRPKTVVEYALGTEKFSTPVLMATMMTLAIGGYSVVGHSALLYKNGLWFFFASLAVPVGYCIMSLVIVPKLSRYYGCLSVAEIVGKMYGGYARRIIGIVAFLFCLGILGVQIKAFYWVMKTMFADNALLSTIICISTVILYSAIGGVSSVTKTGIIQFFIFIVIVPLVISHIVQISGGIQQITSTLSESGRPFFCNGSMASFIALTIFYLLPSLSPVYCHRLLIGRDCKKNQAATYSLAFVSLLTMLFTGCVAFVALTKFPNIKPYETMFVVIENLITNVWAIVAFKIALVAIIVSAVDSLVNTASIILTHDILPSKVIERQKINLLRGATVLSGIIATAFACFFPGVLDIVLFVAEYYAVSVSVPFIAGLFIKEPSQEPFWASAVMGSFTFTMLRFTYDNFRYEAFLVGLIFSLITYLSVFFAFRKQTSPGVSFSVKGLCDRIIGKHAVRLDHISWLILLFFLSSIFLKVKYTSQYGAITFIECITGFLGCSLLFIDKTALKYKNVMALVIILYCFAFAPAYVFLHQDTDNSFFTTNFLVSMVLLAGLFSWDVFLSSVIVGNVVAVLAFYCFGPEDENLIGPVMNLSLLMGLISLVAAFAFRNRELGVIEFIQKKLKASNDIDLAIKESEIYNQILRATKISLEASDKYRDVLLHENETIHVPFLDLKDNILAYFQQTSVEKRAKLTVVNTRHKVLNTGLPLCFFYRTIYSVIANVFYFSKDGRDVGVRFVCDSSGRMEGIEISHGDHGSLFNMSDLAKYCPPASHPEEILGWNILTKLFERLEIKVTEGSKKLKITFPSESDEKDNSIIQLMELLQT